MLSYTPAVLDAQARSFADYMQPANYHAGPGGTDGTDIGVILAFTGEFVILNTIFDADPAHTSCALTNFTNIPGIVSENLGGGNHSDKVHAGPR